MVGHAQALLQLDQIVRPHKPRLALQKTGIGPEVCIGSCHELV